MLTLWVCYCIPVKVHPKCSLLSQHDVACAFWNSRNLEVTFMQIEEKYTRMQILCMHRQRWRKDLTAIQKKPATFARLLGVSHRYGPHHDHSPVQ